MKVVITGASGFIGRRLVRRLLNDGHEVVALSRDPQRAGLALPATCLVRAWSQDSRVLSRVLAGVDAVVHLAGTGVAEGRWTPARKAAIRNSRVHGTSALVDALATLPRASRPRTLVAASAIGFYGDRADSVLGEPAVNGDGFLAEVCKAWEQQIFRAEELGVRTIALRIGIVLGAGGALAAMLPLFRLGAAGRLGDGRQWMSWIHLEDVVRLFQFALANPDLRGPVNATAPEPVTNAVFTRELGRAVGRKAKLPVPALLLRLMLGQMAVIVLGSQRVLPRVAEAHGFEFAFPCLPQALADLCAVDARLLEYEHWVPRSREAVFPFFADAHNLERLTPSFLRFRIRKVSTPAVQAGTLIDYRLKLHGLPIRWRTRIEQWEPEKKFVDVQLRGPYGLWHHTHEFESHEGGTIVRDRVRYRLPLGALGELIAGAWVARDVEKIFAYRQAQIAALFGAPSGQSVAATGA